jgi:hypothetical protein
LADPRKGIRQRRSLYIRHNKTYELLLATLLVIFVAICVIVIGSTLVPTSGVWSDNVLIRMIVQTNELVRGKR